MKANMMNITDETRFYIRDFLPKIHWKNKRVIDQPMHSVWCLCYTQYAYKSNIQQNIYKSDLLFCYKTIKSKSSRYCYCIVLYLVCAEFS